MVGNVVPKQQRGNTGPPPHLASSAKALPAVTRRDANSNKKKEGAGLGDLRDGDKAKVARLINHPLGFRSDQLKDLFNLFQVPEGSKRNWSGATNGADISLTELRAGRSHNWELGQRELLSQVMVAFKEIQRLKEVLELERSNQEALVAKLQQQNREMATEVSHILLKWLILRYFVYSGLLSVWFSFVRRSGASHCCFVKNFTFKWQLFSRLPSVVLCSGPERVNSCYMSLMILNQNYRAQLRLKLASLQLMSRLPSQKVYLHTGKCPTLSPIREAERSEAESEGTRGLVPECIEETQTIVRERENCSSDFTTIAERKDKCIFDESEGTEQCVGNSRMGEFPTSNSRANVSNSIGKENKDPELLPEWTGAPHMASEEDTGVLRKRPPPRPLPDLLSNILHRCKDVECDPSADQSESSVKFVSEGGSLIASVPILQGKVKSTVPQAPPQAAQATRSCFSLALDSVEEPRVDAAPASQGLDDLSTGLRGDQVGCTFHVPCSQTAMTHLAAVQQCQAKTHVDLDGHECMMRSEAGGKDVLCFKHLEGGGQYEVSNFVVLTHCKCTAFHQCLPNCLQHLSSNLTNIACPEQLGGSEKEPNETSNHEDGIGPKICKSQKKLRFDPTAGEEGSFYYVSDVGKNVKLNLEWRSLQPNVPGEAHGVQVGGKTERVSSSSKSSKEGQRLDMDPLESHWAPEAIERRNSFHRIPVVSPRSMNDNERQSDEQTIPFSDSMSAKITETEVGMRVSSSEEQVQPPTSENQVFSLRYEKPHSHKLRPSLQRISKCINCSSVVPLRCRKASQSSKLFAKHARRCSNCSSIVESTSSIHRSQENEKCRGRMTGIEKCSTKGKPSSIEFGSANETCGRGSEEDSSLYYPSTPSRSGNMARCGKCTARPKSRLFKPVQQKQTRGQVGTTSCVPADEEGSNPASTVYCVASEDMYLSTHSNTDDSTKTRRRVPCFPLKVCRIHTRKVKKKRGNRREMKLVELHCGHSSEPTQEVFDVNRAILDLLRQSDGKHKGQLKGPGADSAECWIETWRFGKPQRNSCNKSTDEETSNANSGSFALHGQLHADLDLRRGLKLGSEGRRRAGQHHHVRGRKQSLETWKSFDVDDLLDRFIQSNAEYAAELIKCSVYFESTSSRPSSQGNIVSEEATEDCTLSNLPFQNSMAAKEGIGSHIRFSARGQPRRGLFRVDHNEFTSAPCADESVRCSKCGDYFKPGTLLPPAGAIETVETKERRDLCDTCSVSVAREKKVVRRSADIGPDKSRQSASVPPPIVLPRLNLDNALKLREAGRQQKSVSHPGTADILICDLKNSGDWTADALYDYLPLSGEDHRMPIITGVSVSSRRSTPSMEMEEDGTAKELTDMFDMSLYDLVNDLEGQRRDYWRRVNSHSVEEGTKTGKPVNVDKAGECG